MFQCLQGKAYTIGLIFTLNARMTFKAEMNRDEEVSYSPVEAVEEADGIGIGPSGTGVRDEQSQPHCSDPD